MLQIRAAKDVLYIMSPLKHKKAESGHSLTGLHDHLGGGDVQHGSLEVLIFIHICGANREETEECIPFLNCTIVTCIPYIVHTLDER